VADPDEARTLLVARVLDARRRHAEAFGADAGYRPVGVNGPDAGRIIAFARLDADGRPAMITVVVRPSSSSVLDATVDIADGSWHNLVHATPVTDDPTDVATLTGFVGVAVLRRE
jgi:maltooligosyltrehalose synthase